MFDLRFDSNVLEVFYSNNIFRYRFLDSKMPRVNPVQKGFSNKVHYNIVQSTIRRLDEVIALGGDFSEIKKLGNILYKQLIPDDLAVLLSKKTGALSVVSENQEIPWELLHDGMEFFGIKYMMGRSLVWNAEMKSRLSEAQNNNVKCLIISNPTGDLPEAEPETVVLMKFLRSKKIKCCYLASSHASVDEILLELSSTKYDFIHYSGHIEKHPQTGEYSFLLAGNEFFPISSIKNLDCGSPFVFLNGCVSGRIDILSYDGEIQSRIEGAVIPFLSAGACAVIGSSWKVSDNGARRFSEMLYSYILQGETVGESMSKTRRRLLEENQQDSIWASFVFYGNPGLQFVDLNSQFRLPEKCIRQDFSNDGWRVLECSANLALKSNSVTSMHLFSAIASLNSDILSDFCREKQILLKQLTKLIDDVLVRHEEQNENKTAANTFFSPNSVSILNSARKIAGENKTSIGARELLEAIKTTRGSSIIRFVGLIENSHKAKIANKRVNIESQKITNSEGDFDSQLFEKSLLESLWYAVQLAGDKGISTTHLFLAVLVKHGSLIEKLFNKATINHNTLKENLFKLIGVRPDFQFQKFRNEKISSSRFSSNALKTLIISSQAAAERKNKITVIDMLKAMFGDYCSITHVLQRLGVDTGLLLELLAEEDDVNEL